MTNRFKEIMPMDSCAENVFRKIGKQWMLITAGNETEANTMTASWGTLGVLWGKPVAVCYIRPQRYTFTFTEKSDSLSLSFLSEEYREALKACGAISGRDTDKFKASGLTLCRYAGIPYIGESDNVLICKKIYADYVKEECFLTHDADIYYPQKDFHKFYVCEIQKILVKE